LRARRALITGGGGQLASDLADQLQGVAETWAPARSELDVADAGALDSALTDFEPEVIFNCAAFHNLNVCEEEVERSFAVNAGAVKQLAGWAREHEAKLVHLSTNYVFDGTAPDAYDERDLPNPRSIYAISKLAGEHSALAYSPGALVVRTTGLYGLHGSASKGGNFVTRMLERAGRGESLRMVADQRVQPTFTADLAAGLLAAVERDVEGLVHLTNSGESSWHEFTLEILRLAALDVPVEAVATTIRPGDVQRPLNGLLTSSIAEAAGLAPLRDWRAALSDYMERAQEPQPS